ncbi:hypothetical protein MKW98_007992 [Papaver atlanticum]|uniref:Uncharacterized protein n=1 Tax=Papaver atlanticum TaxID=357466 RepID=A0AAD4S604_9MAGN|nr:hypothetical protein MKW98_007992 [Papaver atlanticum]
MAGSQGGGGDTGGRGRGRGRTRSRAADHHAHVDDEENVYGDLGDFVNVDPNPSLLVNENLAAEIGGVENLVNLADPLHQQIPSAIGGSSVVMSGAPAGEGSSQNRQRKKRARPNPVQNPPPPQAQGPIEHQIPDMGEIPMHLRGPPHHLYRLCRKKLTKSDLKTLNITGDNRPFLKHMAKEAGLALGSGPGLRVDVQVLNDPAPVIGTVLFLRNPGGHSLTLAWRELFSGMDCRLVVEQYIDMWFEMAPPTMNIYIQGR